MDITYASIQELHESYRTGKLTVKEVVLAHLARIAKIDSCEGGLKSVIEVNPNALFIAETLDRRFRETKEMPQLFGIPVLVKDNINAAGLHTTAGSVALMGNSPYNANCLDYVIEKGAVIIGKTNLTEFANYMTREGMPNGYSSRGGQTLCPYNRDMDVSGSSSGSAVAVAAGLCTVSLGTETSGSIISPAGVNGVVGIKPTLGLVGRSGIIPISHTFDTAGPMARNVTDAAILLGLMTASDGDEAYNAIRPSKWEYDHEDEPAPTDYTKFLEGEDLKGIRIGLNRTNEFARTPEGDESIANFDNLCNLLKSAGATLVDNLEMEPRYDTRMTIMQYEFKACMNRYLKRANIKTLDDIIQYNQANAPVALKYGQSLLLDAQNKASGNLTEPAYLEALLEREKAIDEMDKLFETHNLDVILGDAFVYIAPFTGFPSMTIPTGQRTDNNMPLHASWTARRLDEGRMLKIAYIVEKLLGVSIKPEF